MPSGKKRSDVLSALAKDPLDPIYVLHGAESFLIDQCVRTLRKRIVGTETPNPEALNEDVFDLKETGLNAALATARTLAMLCPHRLVIGRGIDLVKAGDLQPLVDYAADPNPKATLVLLTDKSEKVDGRLKAFAALKKQGFVHELRRPTARALPGWIDEAAKKRGLVIHDDARASLAETVGADLGRLAQALEQLELYATEPGETESRDIRRSDVEALIPESKEHGIFELTKAVAGGRERDALRACAAIFRSGELRPQSMALKLQGSLLRQHRNVWRARSLLRRGVSIASIPGAIGIPPFALDEILEPARRLSGAALTSGFISLYKADRALKSSNAQPQVVVMRLVRSLTSAR